jgi:hypothetical protein
MSPRQRAYLMSKPCKHAKPCRQCKYPDGGLWWKACVAQQWDYEDRDLRLHALSEAVGRQITSASQLNRKGDFDAVKRHLGTLADNVRAAMDTREAGEARRTMHLVRELLAELEELHPEPGTYVRTLLQGIHRGRRVEIGGIEDLGTAPRLECNSCRADGHGRSRSCPGYGREHKSELEQFHITLNARVIAMRGMNAEERREMNEAPGEELVEQPF